MRDPADFGRGDQTEPVCGYPPENPLGPQPEIKLDPTWLVVEVEVCSRDVGPQVETPYRRQGEGYGDPLDLHLTRGSGNRHQLSSGVRGRAPAEKMVHFIILS